MVLSKPSSRLLYDEIRKQWVAAQPEEIVRQTLLQQMLYQLQFPKELIAVEKHLQELVSPTVSVPDRRVDVVVFGRKTDVNNPFYPLLLVECKKGECSREALDQLMGYNHFVKAPFVAVVGKWDRLIVLCRDHEAPTYFSSLPTYPKLIEEAACKT